MRIFSRKALQFHHPEDTDIEPVSVEMQKFSDVPDWVSKSKMFNLALNSGVIEVIESKQDEIIAEKGGTTNKRGGNKDAGGSGNTGGDNATSTE